MDESINHFALANSRVAITVRFVIFAWPIAPSETH